MTLPIVKIGSVRNDNGEEEDVNFFKRVGEMLGKEGVQLVNVHLLGWKRQGKIILIFNVLLCIFTHGHLLEKKCLSCKIPQNH